MGALARYGRAGIMSSYIGARKRSLKARRRKSERVEIMRRRVCEMAFYDSAGMS